MIDSEARVQGALGLTATLPDISCKWEQSDGKLPTLLFATLFDETVPHFVDTEWLNQIQQIRESIGSMSPFEIHATATQACVFSDGSVAHWILCLLLCSHALTECPTLGTQRWKRWQSLICETVRLFQKFGYQCGSHATPLWIDYISPACCYASSQLPSNVLHTGILSGLIGVSSQLAAIEPDRLGRIHEEVVLSRAQLMTKDVQTIVQRFNQTDIWVWCNPWRPQHVHGKYEDEAFCIEHFRDQISFWNQARSPPECVAGMDTAWNEEGISLMAMFAFYSRELVLSPEFTWSLYFPHVAVILGSNVLQSPFLESFSLEWIQQFLDAVSGAAPCENPPNELAVNTPYRVFQLLSNRVAVNPQLSGEQRLQAQAKANKIVSLMKSLLSRYPRNGHVKIVKKLVEDCPHVGLQAKFLDLLRPLIFEESCATELWSYVETLMKDLFSHYDSKKAELMNSVVLIERVELYVGGITMLQLFLLARSRMPDSMGEHNFEACLATLSSALWTWREKKCHTPPDDYFHLYLLEDALRRVVELMGAPT